jgi:hypothetical protein
MPASHDPRHDAGAALSARMLERKRMRRHEAIAFHMRPSRRRIDLSARSLRAGAIRRTGSRTGSSPRRPPEAVDRADDAPPRSVAPLLGQHDAGIVRSLDRSGADIAAMRRDGVLHAQAAADRAGPPARALLDSPRSDTTGRL